MLVFDEEADELAGEYVGGGAFPRKYVSDANHVAIAVVNRVEYFMSWNFKHIIKVRTRRTVNLINTIMIYEITDIVAPPEL